MNNSPTRKPVVVQLLARRGSGTLHVLPARKPMVIAFPVRRVERKAA